MMSNMNPQAMTNSGMINLPPLPHISIHAFCETDKGVALMQATFADRHFARTSSQVFTGGIPAAVQAYAQALTPDLLIVESAKDSQSLLAELQALAQVCAPQTKVIVIGHHNDIHLYRTLIAQGVSEYLVMPLQPQDILMAVSNIFGGDSQAASIGRIVAFIGARGGAGSSAIAHNVAWFLAEQYGKNTVVADLDLAYGTAGLDFDKEPAQGIVDALMASDRIDPVLIDRLLAKCSEHLMLLASPASVDRVIDIQEETLSVLLDALRATAPITVLDLPSDWESWTRGALIGADDVIITATPDLVSVRNVKSILDMLKQLRPNDAKPGLVLNKVGQTKNKDLEISMQEFVEAFDIEPLGTVTFAPEIFNAALNEGVLVSQYDPKSEAAKVFDQLARRLLGQNMQEDATTDSSTSKGLFASLRGMLSKVGKKG